MLYRLILCSFSCLFFVTACNKKPTDPTDKPPVIDTTYGSFPDAVGKIFHAKCVDGCHDAATHLGELRLDTWDKLFYGGAHGASVVPYSSANSLLLHYINTDPSKGPVATPGMPYQRTPLSTEEYTTIKEWIAKGAPDRYGKIAFADNADARQKIYVIQQCDQVAVIDAERKVVMRYITIGTTPLPEAPHCIRVSDDGKFAYVRFRGSNYIQKIDTKIDSVVESVQLDRPSWEILLPSPDGNTLMISNMDAGIVRKKDLVSKTYIDNSQSKPHGIAALPGFSTFFITSQQGNVVKKITPTSEEIITLDGKPENYNHSYDPHEIILSPTLDKLFVTCELADSLAVMDTSGNILKKLLTGRFPQEMTVSKKHNYLFISCQDEPSIHSTAQVLFLGAIYVFNYNTLELVKKIDGHFVQPHGIAVDERNGALYVFSRNIDARGPAPHHIYGCGNRNGFFHVYDLNTWEQIQGKRELLENPYSADVRFK